MAQLPITIAPSILSADFTKLGEEVRAVIAAGADMIHFDVMDNHYVPNLTFGPMVCEALIKSGIEAPIDVHLMTMPVDALIEQFAKAGAARISFHPEASHHVDRSLALIKAHGLQAGLVLNPATPLDCLDFVMDKLDFVLLMTVNPGFGGQTFIPAMLDKIKACRQKLDQQSSAISLMVDGGVNPQNIHELAAQGADSFVAGSAVFNHDDYQAQISAMKEAANQARQ